MSARKLVYRCMVCAPAVFLVGLGVHARALSDDFEPKANDARTEKAILAYVPYLQRGEKVTKDPYRAKVHDVRAIANVWLKGSLSGELKPLEPIAYEDTSTEGAKSQIFDAKSHIVLRLVSCARQEAEAGDKKNAISDALLAIQVSNILKYSDFVSLFNCASEQRRALNHLKNWVEYCTADQKKEIAKVLSQLDADEERIERMALRSRQLFMAWRSQNSERPLSIEETQILGEVPAFGKVDSLKSKSPRARLLASTDEQVPAYYSSLKLALGAQGLLQREAQAIAHRLNITF